MKSKVSIFKVIKVMFVIVKHGVKYLFTKGQKKSEILEEQVAYIKSTEWVKDAIEDYTSTYFWVGLVILVVSGFMVIFSDTIALEILGYYLCCLLVVPTMLLWSVTKFAVRMVSMIDNKESRTSFSDWAKSAKRLWALKVFFSILLFVGFLLSFVFSLFFPGQIYWPLINAAVLVWSAYIFLSAVTGAFVHMSNIADGATRAMKTKVIKMRPVTNSGDPDFLSEDNVGI